MCSVFIGESLHKRVIRLLNQVAKQLIKFAFTPRKHRISR